MTAAGNGTAAASTPIRCIVADDHPAILDAVCRFLESESGFELAGRANDGEVHCVHRRAQPQIALLDIHMPGFGGIDIAKLAASSELGRAFTASRAALLLAALDVGVPGFIRRPRSTRLRAIRIVAGGRSYIDRRSRACLGPAASAPADQASATCCPKISRSVAHLLRHSLRRILSGVAEQGNPALRSRRRNPKA
jgi:DNA-binding NarL/FixJ family response regulator